MGRNNRKTKEEAAPPEYVGALLDEEHRLVLVEVDPHDPWEAFRHMRAWMRQCRESRASTSQIDMFAPGADLRNEAKIIPLHRAAP